MFKFTEHVGIVVPLNISNIDTDAIIPKQFLQRISKTGLGKYLFYDWRFLSNNEEKVNFDFILNKDIYKKATILLTQENFGCGSSREHAVWALLDYGFRVIIAPSFSDIFYNNSFNNKLLLITLSQKNIDVLFDILNNNIGLHIKINLVTSQIFVKKMNILFKISEFRRMCLLNDLDSIDLTMKLNKKIEFYEKNVFSFLLERRKFKS